MSLIKIGNPCRPPRRGRPKRKATDEPSPSHRLFKRIKPQRREFRPSVNIRTDDAYHLPEMIIRRVRLAVNKMDVVEKGFFGLLNVRFEKKQLFF